MAWVGVGWFSKFGTPVWIGDPVSPNNIGTFRTHSTPLALFRTLNLLRSNLYLLAVFPLVVCMLSDPTTMIFESLAIMFELPVPSSSRTMLHKESKGKPSELVQTTTWVWVRRFDRSLRPPVFAGSNPKKDTLSTSTRPRCLPCRRQPLCGPSASSPRARRCGGTRSPRQR